VSADNELKNQVDVVMFNGFKKSDLSDASDRSDKEREIGNG
jgi:hypothetical protein